MRYAERLLHHEAEDATDETPEPNTRDVDELLKRVDDGEIIIPSSTAGSTKKFKLTVDDTGTVRATEVTS